MSRVSRLRNTNKFCHIWHYSSGDCFWNRVVFASSIQLETSVLVCYQLTSKMRRRNFLDHMRNMIPVIIRSGAHILLEYNLAMAWKSHSSRYHSDLQNTKEIQTHLSSSDIHRFRSSAIHFLETCLKDHNSISFVNVMLLSRPWTIIVKRDRGMLVMFCTMLVADAECWMSDDVVFFNRVAAIRTWLSRLSDGKTNFQN